MSNSVLRHDTEIGDRPDYFKYRDRFDRQRFFDLFYPNYDNMFLKTGHCALFGAVVGATKGYVEVTNISPLLRWSQPRHGKSFLNTPLQ